MLKIYQYIFITISALPQLDLLRVYRSNYCSQKNNQLRKVYQDNINEIVSDWFSTGIKILMVTFGLSCSILQIFLLLYFEKDQNYKSEQMVHIIIELIFVVIFSQHIIVLIYDATQYGLTTVSTRINFTVTFTCSSVLSFVLYYFGRFSMWCSYLSYAQSLLLFLNCLLINIIPTDYQTKAAIIAEYIHMKQRGATSLFSTENIVNEPREQLLFYKNDNCATFTQSVTKDDNIIQDIHIKLFKESQKYEKRTIIYEIGYNINKQQRTVFRSFREFLSFNHDLKMEFPQEILPVFPNKKTNVKFLSREDVMARQELLDQFLKGIVVRFNKHVFLRQFLNSGNDTPQYNNNYAQPRRLQQRASSQNRLNNSNRQITYASIPETIWEGIGDEEDEVLQDGRKEKKKAAYSHDQNDIFDSNPQNGDYKYKSPQFNGGYKVSLSKTFEQYANENLQNDSDNEGDQLASPRISFQ